LGVRIPPAALPTPRSPQLNPPKTIDRLLSERSLDEFGVLLEALGALLQRDGGGFG
jgi:hypothetical protein